MADSSRICPTASTPRHVGRALVLERFGRLTAQSRATHAPAAQRAARGVRAVTGTSRRSIAGAASPSNASCAEGLVLVAEGRSRWWLGDFRTAVARWIRVHALGDMRRGITTDTACQHLGGMATLGPSGLAESSPGRRLLGEFSRSSATAPASSSRPSPGWPPATTFPPQCSRRRRRCGDDQADRCARSCAFRQRDGHARDALGILSKQLPAELPSARAPMARKTRYQDSRGAPLVNARCVSSLSNFLRVRAAWPHAGAAVNPGPASRA